MDKENKEQVNNIINETTKKSIKQYFGIDLDSDMFSPTQDYVFKRIFTADEKRSKIALIDFLNSVLEFEYTNKIVELTVVNPEIPVDIVKRKKSIFDVRVKFNDGEQAIIEMQISNVDNFKKRSQFIISKAYVSQEIAGLDYNTLKKCYLICITNFVLLNSSQELVNDYRYRDKAGKDLSEDETIIFIELPKIDKIIHKPINEMSNLEMWAIFFRYVTDKSKRDILNTIINRKEGINMAVNVLDEISKNEQERIQYENELIFDLDIRSNVNRAKADGRAEGKAEGKVEVIKNALLKGLSIDMIAEITNFDIETIKKIQDEIDRDQA